MEGPQAITGFGVHERLLQMYRGQGDELIADIPAGQGALALSLHGRGHTNIISGEIDTDLFRPKGALPLVKLDLREPLPFADGSFDAMFCVEAIEHMENPYHLMRELARVIRPGGRLFLTTPNVMSTNARSKFFSVGYLPHFKEMMVEREKLKNMGFLAHISPVSFIQLKFMLHLNGLELLRVETNKFKRRPRLKDRITAYIVKVCAKRFEFEDGTTYDELTSDAVLYGDTLIFEIAKPLEA